MNVEEAIRTGFDRCRGSSSSVVALGGFLRELRQQGWGDLDLQVVERAVLRLLATALDES